MSARLPALAVLAVVAVVSGALTAMLTAHTPLPTGHPVVIRTYTPETPTVTVFHITPINGDLNG